MSEKIELTKKGYDALIKEYRDLIDNKRPEYKIQLKEAREQGDLSENADYDAAKDMQAQVEGRIQQIEHDIHNCIIIDETKNGKKIGLGSKVRIKVVATGEEKVYTLTGTTEANPLLNQISKDCPVGQALMGKEAGQIVTIKARKEYQVEIISANED